MENGRIIVYKMYDKALKIGAGYVFRNVFEKEENERFKRFVFFFFLRLIQEKLDFVTTISKTTI